MKLLITAFEPFGGELVNPSMMILETLPTTIGSIELVKAVLPVTFESSTPILKNLIDQHQPDVILSLGQAGGRTHISVEKIGINLDHARIPDNDGNQFFNKSIDPNHPDGYFSTLPVNAMVKAMLDAGVPAAISYSAGTYVCNHVMFVALAHIHENKLPIRSGFIHIPFLPIQTIDKVNQPSMSLQEMTFAIHEAIKVLENEALQWADIDLNTGTTH